MSSANPVSFLCSTLGKQTARQFGHEFALLTSSLPNHATKHSRWKVWLQCVLMMSSLLVPQLS
jgi:hypothetical protein